MSEISHFPSRAPRVYFYALAVGIVLVDQLSKWWIDANMFLGRSRGIVEGYFNLTYVANDGIAFGFFQGRNYLMGLFAAIILGVAYFYARSFDWRKKEVNLVGAMILGGAIGNLIDRFRKGYVIDFLDFHWMGHHWPAFNVADACISVSIVWVLIRLLVTPKREG